MNKYFVLEKIVLCDWNSFFSQLSSRLLMYFLYTDDFQGTKTAINAGLKHSIDIYWALIMSRHHAKHFHAFNLSPNTRR